MDPDGSGKKGRMVPVVCRKAFNRMVHVLMAGHPVFRFDRVCFHAKTSLTMGNSGPGSTWNNGVVGGDGKRVWNFFAKPPVVTDL